MKKIHRKRVYLNLSLNEAKKLVIEKHPRIKYQIEYDNHSINTDLDLSIIVPVYNYVDKIEKTINAVLSQKTKYSYQVILVDDGSTDGSADILRKFQGNMNVKLIFQENAGIGAARNTGINASDGKYLMFVDCDDIVHDDIIEVLLDKAYSDEYDMVMCAHNLSKERDGEVYEVIPNIYTKKNLMGYKNGDKIMNLAGLPWCKVYKRELWDNVRFFPGYWYEDTIIQFLIFTQCKHFDYIPVVEYEYKWYEKNYSHVQGKSENTKAIDIYWLLNEILDRYNYLGLPKDNALYTLILRHISTHYYSCIKMLDDTLVQALFVMAGELYVKYKPKEKVRLPYMLKQVEKAFDEKDIELWKLASSYL